MLIHYPDIDDHLDFLENQEGNLFFLSRAQVGMNNCKPFVKEVIDTIITSDDKHTLSLLRNRPTGGDGTSEKQCSPSALKSKSMTATTRFMPSLCQQMLYQLLLSVDRSTLN